MLCYWGSPVRDGLGLTPRDGVKHGKCGIKSICPKSPVQDISAGRTSIRFIQDGKVSVLRQSDGGELKQLDLKKVRIRSMVSRADYAVLLDYKGKVLTMMKKSICRPLKGLESKQVTQIACGDQHSMALTNDGQLFVWGDNSHGQLGLGKILPNTSSPEHLLSGIPAAQISAGGGHSFVLSFSGAVFGWGKNSAGQLGLGDTQDRYLPSAVESLNGKKTVSISCGGEHTATLSKGGTVFTFGSGGSGQLGHNSLKDEHHPRLVAELWGAKVSQISCGRQHTLVATTKKIYSFGQLENGEITSVPSLVDLPLESSQYTIDKVIAGENNSFVLLCKESALKSRLKPRGIVTLEERMIERWVSGKDAWKIKKREIYKVFSSAASLNGSFLKTSGDAHYQTSEEDCGLDFDRIRKSFARLSVNENAISEATKGALQSLNSNPACPEALRLYLLIPELIRGLHAPQTDLIKALASKILQLWPAEYKVLENYWSKLPDSSLQNLVDVFKKVSAEMIGKITATMLNSDKITDLNNFLSILKMLYQVCCRVNRAITKTDFIIHEVNYLLLVLQTTNDDMNNNWMMLNLSGHIEAVQKQRTYYYAILYGLLLYPCIFNLEAKCSYMKSRLWRDSFSLILRRTALTEDCFSQLRTANPEDLSQCFLSVFYTEDMKQTSVNNKDFFYNVFKELCAPESQLLKYNDNETIGWFPTTLTLEKERYFLFGILCGLAFSNCTVVNLPFPLAMFKKLLNIRPSLEDLMELDSALGRSLQYILDYSDDVEELDMYFTITWNGALVELDPSMPGKRVTNSNRKNFVDKYVDHIFNASVEEVFEEFKRGFFSACHTHLVKMFEPEEMRGLLVGNEEYDWDMLKKNTKYETAFYPEHPTIVYFWEVFDELTPDVKKAFLLFLTGFERVPVLGMSAVKMLVTLRPCSTEDHLPESQTCYSRLLLPEYRTKETLRAKLFEAISHNRGFWEE